METGKDPIYIEKTCKIHAKYKLNYEKLRAGVPLIFSILDLRGPGSTGVVEVS